MIYCTEIWGISPQSHLRPLLLLQKKIVRIMTFSTYYAHTDPLFKDLNILTIDNIFNRHKSDIRKTWCLLNETLNRNVKKQPTHEFLVDNIMTRLLTP